MTGRATTGDGGHRHVLVDLGMHGSLALLSLVGLPLPTPVPRWRRAMVLSATEHRSETFPVPSTPTRSWTTVLCLRKVSCTMPLALLALAVVAFGIGTTEFATMGLLPQIADGIDVSVPHAGEPRIGLRARCRRRRPRADGHRRARSPQAAAAAPVRAVRGRQHRVRARSQLRTALRRALSGRSAARSAVRCGCRRRFPAGRPRTCRTCRLEDVPRAHHREHRRCAA